MMVSSKFAGMLPPFKVPAVCKKKLPEGPPPPTGDPLPGDVLDGFFAIHGNYAGVWIDYEDTLPMPKQSAIRYISEVPPPPDGAVILMNWNPATYMWSGALYLYVGTNIRYAFTKAPSIYELNANFDTGEFEWWQAGFTGEKLGRFSNPL